eukprot:959928-Prymnesium_polylepis.1
MAYPAGAQTGTEALTETDRHAQVGRSAQTRQRPGPNVPAQPHHPSDGSLTAVYLQNFMKPGFGGQLKFQTVTSDPPKPSLKPVAETAVR